MARAETSAMAINGLGSTAGAAGAGNTAGSTAKPGKKNFQLETEDFIKMMITQLQNQDPMEPAKNQELLAQMSQIGQLQSATSLQESLKGMVTQNQIGSAAALIGKNVQGLDANDDPVNGLVTSVRVESDGVSLELDSGKRLPLTRVTSISPQSSAAAAPAPVAG
jgi:flagellar basal-body rod modification protein FlgD